MPRKSEIVKSLQRLTKTESQGDDESRQEFLERLVTNSNEHFEKNEEAWDEQPQATQSWLNAAVKALDAGKEIVDPDEVDEESEDDAEEETDDTDAQSDEGESNEEEEEMTTAAETATTTKKKKAAPAKKAKPAKKATPKKEKTKKSNGAASRGTGAQTVIKQIMLKNPNISTDELIEKLASKGLKPTKVAVTSIRSGMRHTLNVMKDAGVLHSSIKLGKEA